MEPKWLVVMRSRLGVQEIPGPRENNKTILKWFQMCGHPEIETDEVSWCAITVGSALVECGLPIPPRETNMLARSYLKYGVECEPKVGAIAVWPRGNSSWQGHVNVIEKVLADGRIVCIGGNQSGKPGGDAVTRTRPMSTKTALGFRYPVEPTEEALAEAGSSEINTALAVNRVLTVGGATATTIKVADETNAIDTIKNASDGLGVITHAMEGVQSVVKFAAKGLWIVVLVGLVYLYIANRKWIKQRIARHKAGAPIFGKLGS